MIYFKSFYSFVKGVQVFEDPDGKIELPPPLKVDQWRRPVDFLPSDRVREKKT
jgi:hypothetical protein